jgi:CTP synthase
VGIQPDVLVLRTELELPAAHCRKVAQFCNVSPDAVTQSLDAPSIYEVPLMMHRQRLDQIILEKTGTPYSGEPDLKKWNFFLDKLHNAKQEVKIGLVGKYVELQDAYKSIDESLFTAGVYQDHKVKITYISSEKINDDNAEALLSDMDGVIVAPGFGQRGTEGKFAALKWCREHDMPTFGICYGMQCMVIEYARNVLGLADANSVEINPKTRHNVIDLMEEQKSVTNMGGTMRLGAYACHLKDGTKVAKAYGKLDIEERHRHRFEFNDEFRKQFEDGGMIFAGENPETHLVEVMELPGKKWYIGTQYHPEYSSTVLIPHPLFMDFVRAAIENKNSHC